MVAIEQHKKICLELPTETKKPPRLAKEGVQQILQNQNSKSLRSKEQKS